MINKFQFTKVCPIVQDSWSEYFRCITRNNEKSYNHVFEHHNHTRHFGANALEMAMFAQGLMDIFIDLRGKIRIQDIAAGYIIVKEAGGLLLDAEFKFH